MSLQAEADMRWALTLSLLASLALLLFGGCSPRESSPPSRTAAAPGAADPRSDAAYFDPWDSLTDPNSSSADDDWLEWQELDSGLWSSCAEGRSGVERGACVFRGWAVPLMWLGLLSCGVWWFVLRVRRGVPTGRLWAALGVAAAGIVVRLLLADKGPGCVIHPMVDDVILCSDQWYEFGRYGPGGAGLFALLFSLLEPSLDATIWVNMLAAGASIVAMAALAWRLGGADGRASRRRPCWLFCLSTCASA